MDEITSVSPLSSSHHRLEKAKELLGLQLGQLTRPLFESFEETGDASHGSFITHILSNTFGENLVEDPAFNSLVQDISDSLIQIQEKGVKSEL